MKSFFQLVSVCDSFHRFEEEGRDGFYRSKMKVTETLSKFPGSITMKGWPGKSFSILRKEGPSPVVVELEDPILTCYLISSKLIDPSINIPSNRQLGLSGGRGGEK